MFVESVERTNGNQGAACEQNFYSPSASLPEPKLELYLILPPRASRSQNSHFVRKQAKTMIHSHFSFFYTTSASLPALRKFLSGKPRRFYLAYFSRFLNKSPLGAYRGHAGRPDHRRQGPDIRNPERHLL